jgi:hypothetical protein
MKKFNSFFISLGTISFISFLYGCATSAPNDPYYVDPARQERNVYQAPANKTISLLTEKNQFMIGGNYIFNHYFEGFDLQAGYMATDHIGFIGGYRNMEYGNSYDNFIFSSNEKLGTLKGFDLGAGYVTRLSPIMHFESYVGYSGSTIKNYHHTGISTIGQTNFFIQPALGINSTNNRFQFAIMSRLSRGNFKIEKETYNKDREQIVAANLDALRENPRQIFFEPGVVFRIGSDYFKGQFIYSVLTNLSGGKQKADNTNFSVGIILQSPPKNINKKKSVR